MSAVLLSLLLLVGLVAVALPAAAAPTFAAPAASRESLAVELVAGSGDELAVADLASAVSLAAAWGERVEVANLTTERERHLANPDGSVTLEAHVVPQRVRGADRWVPVDTDLALVEGRVAPAATVLDLSFSAGGTDDLIVLHDAGRKLALSWPGELPAPLLSGDTATYREVLPGIDLVVRAEPASFAHMLVVKNRSAARNPALRRVAWQVSTQGLSLRTADGGAVEAVDAVTGEVVFAAPAPSMWDSPPAPDRGDRELEGLLGEPLGPPPGAQLAPGRVETIPVELSAGELAVRPDLEMLADAQTTFPVWIDPSFSEDEANWAPVFSSQPNSSWPSGTGQPRDSIRAGNLNWAGCGSWCGRWRSHLRFTIGEMSGEELVSNPDFRITLDHSASCGSTPVELWRTNTIGSSGDVTWNSMSSKWLTNFGARSAHANEAGGCSDSPQDDERMEWSTSTMRNRLQDAMDRGNTTFTFGLRADNESDRFQWKYFHRNSALLVATYNLPPRKPDQLTIDADCYQQCSSPAVVRTLRPWLQARVRDPHGATLRAEFQVRTLSGIVVSTGTVNNVGSGDDARFRPPSNLAQETTYTFRVRARNQHLTGPWSGELTFTTDTRAPALPVVSSQFYPHKDTGTWSGGVGQPGSFTFDPNASDDVIEYRYRWLGGGETAVPVAEGAGETVRLTPPGDLEQVLEVRAIDVAGNISGWRAYPFLVRPGAVDVAYWKFDEGAGTLAQPATGDGFAGVLHGGAGWAASGINEADPGASGTAVALDGVDDYVEMPRVLATDHSAGFTVTAWVNPAELTGYHAVAAQTGENTTMFLLYYKPETSQWCLRVAGTDDPLGPRAWACSTATPQVGKWTHLAAVYDKPGGKIRLWVNGGPNNGEPVPGTVTETNAPAGSWAAGGSFTVGQGESSPSWSGRIDEVRVHQRVLGEFEIQQTFLQCKYALCPPAPEPTEPVLVGQWDLDEGSGGVASDSSGRGNHATLVGDSEWTTGGLDGTPGIRFTGAGQLQTDGPMLVHDQSFTVSAWVKLDGYTGTEQVVMRAGGAGSSAFKLFYRHDIDRWRFASSSPHGEDSMWHIATGVSPPDLARWTHLVGVFDADQGELRLYEDGQLVGTGTGAAVREIVSPLLIGWSAFPVDGTIDAVRAYQTALSDQQVFTLFRDTLDTHYAMHQEQRPFLAADETVLPVSNSVPELLISLPFPMTIVDHSGEHAYDEVEVSLHGRLTFWEPGYILWPFYDFLEIDASSSVRTELLGTAPDRTFVIEWRNLHKHDEPTRRVSFEVVLTENGGFWFNYAGIDPGDEGAWIGHGWGQMVSSFDGSVENGTALVYTRVGE